MRYRMMGVGLAAAAAAASAQDQAPSWQYFEPEGGTIQAGVVAADGSQLILKCDKPGKRSVYAVLATREKLVPATAQAPFQMRSAEFRFDEGAPTDDRWRFYDQSAVAIDSGSIKAMSHFLPGLRTATKLRIRLNPERARYVEANFNVAGAADAIGRVYASCQDDIPTG